MPQSKTATKTAKTTKPKVVKIKPAKAKTASSKFSVPSFALTGKESGNLELPKELFGAKVNQQLILQAIRVYTSNQTGHHSHTKTRSEVGYSTRKIYRQKGTGGARHGSKRAPIFVGGGIALGPRSRKVTLDLPKKMKKAALSAALSYKKEAGEIYGISGLDKATGKTKQMSEFLKISGKKDVLLVVDKENEKVFRAGRNLVGLAVLHASQLNFLDALSHQTLMFTKEAVEVLEKRMKGDPPATLGMTKKI